MNNKKFYQEEDFYFFTLLVLVSGLLRFLDLGGRAIHYDESLHAFYAWKLFSGQGYQHSAMMHGPFQFIGTAFVFKLFGANDFSARILAAFFGTALVGLPYFLRSHLGRAGAILVAILFAFSPAMVYLSRFARSDVYFLVWTMLLVMCLWRYIENGRVRYLYIATASLSLAFATKETVFITVVIFCIFLALITAREIFHDVLHGFSFGNASRPLDFLILIAALSIPLYSAGFSIFQKRWGIILTGAGNSGWPEGIPEGSGLAVAGFILGILLTISIVTGLHWKPRQWKWHIVIFWGIFTLLYTTFFTNRMGLASGTWQSLGYWLAQQPKHRLTQPWFYYPLELSIYEFFPALLAVCGIVYFTFFKRSLFTSFLVYWFLATIALYLYAGEKAPWLIVHLLLPLMLISGKFAADLLKGVVFRAFWLRSMFAVTMGFLFVLTLITSFQLNYKHDDSRTELMVYAQGSSDLPVIMKDIESLALKTGEGKNLKITVDSSLTWPWAWYLRDYKLVGYPDLTSMNRPPDGSVLILLAGNENAAKPYVDKYKDSRKFRQLLWFPERHKDLKGKTLFTSANLKKWWDYFRTRDVEGSYWKSDGIAYFIEPPG